MSQSVRVGVVSTSWWADKMFLPALKSHAQADVVAICGRNRTRAEEMAGKYGVRAVFADYRKMIEQGGLDAVIVGVPDDLHYEVTMQALHAGLHVLCEQSDREMRILAIPRQSSRRLRLAAGCSLTPFSPIVLFPPISMTAIGHNKLSMRQ